MTSNGVPCGNVFRSLLSHYLLGFYYRLLVIMAIKCHSRLHIHAVVNGGPSHQNMDICLLLEIIYMNVTRFCRVTRKSIYHIIIAYPHVVRLKVYRKQNVCSHWFQFPDPVAPKLYVCASRLCVCEYWSANKSIKWKLDYCVKFVLKNTSCAFGADTKVSCNSFFFLLGPGSISVRREEFRLA